MNTTLIDRLTSNPSHFSFTSSHVRSRNIDTWSKESFLCKLNSKPPSDPLKLILTVQLRVNLNISLSSAKRNINTGTLVCHQSRKGLHLICTNIQRVTDTSLARVPMMRVLSSVSINHFICSIILLKRKVDLQ